MAERTSSILKKYLFSYIFVFSIPFIVFVSIINRIYIQDVREETSIGNQEQLEQSNILLNEQLVEIKTIGNYIKAQNSFNRFTPYVKDDFNIYRELIKQHEITTSSINELYVIYSKGARIFGAQGTTNLPALYSTHPRFSRMENERQFEEFLFSGEEGFYVHEQHIYYTLPLGVTQGNTGIILIDLNTQLIKDSLQTMNRSSQGTALLVDADNNLLLAPRSEMLFSQEEVSQVSEEIRDKNEFRLGGKKYFVEKAVNDLTGWSFLTVTDARSYNQPFYRAIALSIAVIILILGIGLFFSYYFAKKNYQPLKSLLTNLELSDELEENEWSILEKNMMETYSEVESLNSLVDQQTPIVRNATMLDLIKGDLRGEEIEKSFQELDIQFPYAHYAVGIIEFDKAQLDLAGVIQQHRLSKKKEKIRKSKNYRIDFAMPYLNNYQVFLIINIENDTQEHWDNLMDNVQKNFRKVVSLEDTNFIIAVGSAYEDLQNVNKSYIEASTVLETGSKSVVQDVVQDNVIYFKDIEERLSKRKRDSTIEYPMNAVLLLLQSLKKTNYAVANDTLTQIFEKIERENTDELIRRVLVFYVFNNIVELSQELELKDYSSYLYELEQTTELDASFKLLDQLMYNICNEIEDQQKVANEELGESISTYVYENFSSPDISLEKIAEQFQVSISYVSQLVKEETGETFSVIVQNLRMDKFKKLLVSTTKPINQLVKEIGYFDASNFSRKFRKENDMTPSQFREKYKDINE